MNRLINGMIHRIACPAIKAGACPDVAIVLRTTPFAPAPKKT